MSVVMRMLQNRRSILSGGVVALFGAGLVVLALWYDGEATADVDLNDSGVWVTQSSTGQLGRFNYEAQALDGTMLASSVSFDVQQDAQRVLLENRSDRSASPVDPAQLTVRGTLQLPSTAQIVTGAATTAVYDAESGHLWVLPFDGATAFDPDELDPDVEAGPGGTVTVSKDGTVFLVVPEDHLLHTVTTGSRGAMEDVSEERYSVPGNADLQLTTVGDRLVALDRTSGRVILPGGDAVDVDGGSQAQLQQASHAADDVVVATPGGLVYQPLDGSRSTTRAANGTPARPVYLGECVYGAWSVSGQVIRDCPGTDRDVDMVLEGISSDSTLAYRVNRQVIVLNDMVNGTLWMAADDFQKVDDWELTMPENAEGEEAESEETIPEQVDQFVADRDEENRPPIAHDDVFGVRPGATTVLDVLGNDVDPDGDVMTADVSRAPDGPISIDRVMDGAALQADVPADASGSVTFEYEVEDGRGGSDTAQVTLHVVPLSDNEPPVQTGEPVLTVGQDGVGTIKVLPYFQDPEGDDLFLSHAGTTDPLDEVRFRPDGTVEFRDGGGSTGRKIVDLMVSDSFGLPIEGRLLVDVVAANVPPVAVQVHATTLVGEPVAVEPMRNDYDPNGDTLRLVHVAEVDGLEITRNLPAGVFTARSDEAGSYDVVYQVSDGPEATLGLVRIDVVEPPDDDAPPIVVSDQVLLPSDGSALVDVLANDTDPAGGVLVVQSVDTPADLPVDVTVLNHQVLRVTATKRLTEPVTFEYTVANGSGTSTGQVRVVPIPASDVLRPPEAAADDALVQVGDVVTIPVLANDLHPDGLELTLADELVEEPDSALGRAFVAEDVVRFHAGPEAGTAHLVYEVVDSNGQKDSAQVTITIADSDENAAPQVPQVEARVLSGRTVRIGVPLEGTDPDGDYVSLTALTSSPRKGTATIRDGYIDYTAADSATGVDVFRFGVVDTRGATAEGTVRVGISPPPANNQPPRAVDDEVTVRPGRTVAIQALENDVDPDGDEIGLVRDGFEGVPDELDPEVVDEQVVVTAPEEEGAYSFYYTIQDDFGARALGAITVNVDPDAPLLRPIARDDIVSAEDLIGVSTVTVDVLANDVDPDGVAADLEVTVDEGIDGVEVLEDKQVAVEVLATPQVIPYTVTDMDGLEATAFIRVPGGQARPFLDPDAEPLEATSGEPLSIDLTEYVVVRDGRSPRITEERTVTTTEGNVEVQDQTTIVYTSAEDFAGLTTVSFEVTDGERVDDPEGLSAILSLPVEVVPIENLPPEITGAPVLEVAAGEDATVDLARYVRDPDGDELSFEVDRPGEGISLSVSGGTVTAQAEPSVPKGTVRDVAFTVSDGHNDAVRGSLALSVVASTRPLVQTTPDDVPDAHQGVSTSVAVLENDTNPFPDTPLRLVGAAVEVGQGSVDFTDREVVVTPGENFHGVMRVRYTVEDATRDPDRHVDGTLNVIVLGRPEPPRAPRVEEVRSQTVVLSWEPPNNNGAEITGYVLRADDGTTRECATTTCTFDGLTNNVTYTFTVAAVNEVGESEASPSSAEARPDEKPDPPAAPELEFGDEQLTVTWANRTYTDRSPIECVNLEISPAPADGRIQRTCVTGTTLVWDGLTNGTAYTVRVQAVNAAPDPSDWGADSAPEVPAGPPFQPAAPTASRVDTALGGQTTVRWTPPNNNGDAIATYHLTVREGSSAVRTIEVPGGQTSRTVEGLDPSRSYTFTVAAENKAGTSETSGASNAVVPYGTPAVPTGVSARLGDNTNGRAQVSWSASSDFRGPGPYYQVRANGSGVRDVGNVTQYTYTGLSNGTAYTFQVRACNQYTCSGWSDSSNSVTPYTVPGQPGVSWTRTDPDRGQMRVTAPSSNGGRAVTRVEWQWTQGTSGSGSQTSTPFTQNTPRAYSTTYTLRARACNDAGCGSWNSASGSTAAPPTPRAWVSRGSATGVVPGCSSGSCHYFRVNTENFEAGTYRVECWSHNNPQSNAGWHNIRTDSSGRVYTSPGGPSESVRLPANGQSANLGCFYGHAGTRVAVVIDGTRYEERIW